MDNRFTPYICTEENFEQAENNCQLPFEYSHTSVWDKNFFDSEYDDSMKSLKDDISEIKRLVKEIRDCIKSDLTP